MPNATEMAILFSNSVEEICHVDEELEHADLANKVAMACQLSHDLLINKKVLALVFATEPHKEYNSSWLVYLAKLKYCLKMLVKYNCGEESSINLDSFAQLNANLQRLFESVGSCKQLETLHNFIVKEIIRKYGSSQFKSVSNDEQLRWLVPNEIFGAEFTVSDKYILMDDEYLTIKQTLISCLQDNNARALDDLFAASKSLTFAHVAAALYRNITYLFKSQPNLSVSGIFEPVLSKHHGKQRQFWQPLLENSLMHNLKITETSCQKFDVNAVLVQLRHSILLCTSRPIKNLAVLMTSPGEFKNSFMPAMPQDSVFDTQKAISESGRGNENPTWYVKKELSY